MSKLKSYTVTLTQSFERETEQEAIEAFYEIVGSVDFDRDCVAVEIDEELTKQLQEEDN